MNKQVVGGRMLLEGPNRGRWLCRHSAGSGPLWGKRVWLCTVMGQAGKMRGTKRSKTQMQSHMARKNARKSKCNVSMSYTYGTWKGCYRAWDRKSRTDDSKWGKLTSWKRCLMWFDGQNLSGRWIEEQFFLRTEMDLKLCKESLCGAHEKKGVKGSEVH